MKRLSALLLCLCLLLTGCSKAPRYHYDVRQDLGIYFTNADAVIETIRDSLRERRYQIVIRYRSHRDNLEELDDIVRELMDCALSETDSPVEGDYLRCQYGGYTLHSSYRTEESDYCYEVTIEPVYYTTAAQEAQVTERIGEILRELDLSPAAADSEKVQAVYDYVTTHVRYDTVHAKHPNHSLKATAYAALFQGQAVCQGYAVLLYRLLRELHVETRILTGKLVAADGTAQAHAWNIVQLDGQYYHLDAVQGIFLAGTESVPDHIRDAASASELFDQNDPMAVQDYALPGKENAS